MLQDVSSKSNEDIVDCILFLKLDGSKKLIF